MDTAARRRQLPVTKLLWLALLLAAAIAVATNVGELRGIGASLRSAEWGFVAAAAAVEALFLINLAMFYTSTFRASRLHADPARFVLVTCASHFVNLVSKTGGLGGMAPFVGEARRTGDPPARVSAAYMIAFVLGYAAYFAVLLVALALLYVRGSLTAAELIASAIIFGIVAVVSAAAVAALRSEASLERLYLLGARPLNAAARLLRRPPFIGRQSAHEHAVEMYDAVVHVRRQPGRYAVPFAHALAVEIISPAMLYLIARALHADIGFEAALAAYAISLLFSMIAITPSGLGFVEASLSVLLVSFGVPRHDAIATALGYRLFDFWLPLLLGAVSLRLLGREAPPATAT